MKQSAVTQNKLRSISIASVLFVLFHFPLEGQLVFNDRAAIIEQDSVEKLSTAAFEIIDSIYDTGLEFDRADILTSKNEIFLTVDGSFDIFIWENHKWTSLYKGIFFDIILAVKSLSIMVRFIHTVDMVFGIDMAKL